MKNNGIKLLILIVLLSRLMFTDNELNETQDQLLAQEIKYQIMVQEELTQAETDRLDVDGDGSITSADYLRAKDGEY